MHAYTIGSVDTLCSPKKNMNDKSNNCVVCYTIAAVAVTTKLTCDNVVTRKIHTENLEQQQ